jgi:hypothetical protein
MRMINAFWSEARQQKNRLCIPQKNWVVHKRCGKRAEGRGRIAISNYTSAQKGFSVSYLKQKNK